jgi:hypothetical protein
MTSRGVDVSTLWLSVGSAMSGSQTSITKAAATGLLSWLNSAGIGDGITR